MYCHRAALGCLPLPALSGYFGKDREFLQGISHLSYLFLQLIQLGGEVGHELHGGVEFVLQVADLILLPFPFIADQRHGSHPGEPVQVLVLGTSPQTKGVGVRGQRGAEKIRFKRQPPCA